MSITALGYLALETSHPDDWASFGSEILGLRVDSPEPDGSLRMRMDDRWARFFVSGGERERIASYGWEVRDAAALDELASRLEKAGCQPVLVAVNAIPLPRRAGPQS